MKWIRYHILSIFFKIIQILRENKNQELLNTTITEIELIGGGGIDLSEGEKQEVKSWRENYGVNLPSNTIYLIFNSGLSARERAELVSRLNEMNKKANKQMPSGRLGRR